jgi:hypothetical protein
LLRLVLFSVAFEAEVRGASSVSKVCAGEVIILNTASAFDRADSVPFTITKAGDSAGGEPERRLDYIGRVKLLCLENLG